MIRVSVALSNSQIHEYRSSAFYKLTKNGMLWQNTHLFNGKLASLASCIFLRLSFNPVKENSLTQRKYQSFWVDSEKLMWVRKAAYSYTTRFICKGYLSKLADVTFFSLLTHSTHSKMGFTLLNYLLNFGQGHYGFKLVLFLSFCDLEPIYCICVHIDEQISWTGTICPGFSFCFQLFVGVPISPSCQVCPLFLKTKIWLPYWICRQRRKERKV